MRTDRLPDFTKCEVAHLHMKQHPAAVSTLVVYIGNVLWLLCFRHVGPCQGLPKGYWVGVQYDEPVGKNDGTIRGVQYFSCLPSYGAFVRPDTVIAGDFPPLDDVFSDEDEI